MDLFVSTFFTVGLLGFQQQNVSHGHYAYAAITSMSIAFAQYAMIASVSHGGSWVLMGLGGAAGVTASMAIHRKYVRRMAA